METLNQFLATLVSWVWGLPIVMLLIGGGIFFTLYLGGVQFRFFGHAIAVLRGKYDDPSDPGEISHFAALCTALSSTVGLGNIAGVAVAIKMGGPGATLWMILAGLLGMATKYTECSLAVMYRKIDSRGVVHGGAMHYIEQGLGRRYIFFSYMFAVCCILGAFGAANMFQTNQVAAILESNFEVPRLLTGILLGIATGIVIIGGIRRIGNVAGKLVPIMGALYVVGSLIVIVANIGALPTVVVQMVSGALSGTAAAGGFAGAAVREVLVQGIRRAVFSNEAGLGTAAIAHSAARTDEPIREGVVALMEPFIDTVVICTMTAMVINITGAWTEPETGVELTAVAFNKALPGFGTYFIPVAVTLFAYSTLISWSYYGERSIDYLVGEKGILPYKILFCFVAVLGSIWAVDPILNFSDSALGLMVIPNMLAMLLMAPRVRKATIEYSRKLEAGEFPTKNR